ncbi:MAG: hypothetical protein K0U98_20795 [Deltaproteobacteria bacterium]|nr:hypothetical protein [Deltaproteobacteria bacterium]
MKLRAVLSPLAAGAVAFLLSAPVFAAQTFTVHLENGNEFETLRQPKQAPWDENTVLVLTDAGNWIGLAKADVERISSSVEDSGFGRIIDSKTIAIGLLANDAPVEGEPGESTEGGAEGAAISQILNRYNEFMDGLEERTFSSGSAAEESYSTEQFVEPGSSTGVPLGVYDDY